MAAFEVIALDTATPQLRAPGAGDTYSLPRTATQSVGTLTSAVPIFDWAATWNSGATTFTGLRLNVTDTASNSASLLADFQTGGVTKLSIAKGGTVTTPEYFITGSSGGFLATSTAWIFAGSVTVPSTGTFRWSTTANPQAAVDLQLAKDAGNVLAQRNGTNAQTFNIYNTFTDASNYERGFVRWSSNVLQIGAEAAGTGTVRNITLTGGNVGIGTTSPSAALHIKAGTAAANTAPLKLTSGTNLTTPENGAFEYNGTNLFFTRAGAVREGVITQSAVTTETLVSDTSVTVNIGGTTYKLLARA